MPKNFNFESKGKNFGPGEIQEKGGSMCECVLVSESERKSECLKEKERERE